MGQTYAVSLKVQFKDEEGAKKALKDKINRGDEDNVNYGAERLQSQHGFDLENIYDLMSVFFCGFGNRLEKAASPGVLTSGFDACYGWESVMMRAFEVMAPFLEDESWIAIYPDSGKDVAIVKGGKAEWVC